LTAKKLVCTTRAAWEVGRQVMMQRGGAKKRWGKSQRLAGWLA